MADPRKNIRALSLAPPSPATRAQPPAPAQADAPPSGSSDDRPLAGRMPSHELEATGPTDRSRTRRTQRSSQASGSTLRTKRTNLYIARDTRARIDAARAHTGVSAVDAILQAVHAEWQSVAEELTSRPSTDDSLELPPPRRPIRAIADATTLQLRLSQAEHAGLTKLAGTAGISVSALVSTCINKHWPAR